MIGHEACFVRAALRPRLAVKRLAPVFRFLPLDGNVDGDRTVQIIEHDGLGSRQFAGKHDRVQVLAIVRGLDAVDERTAHQRHAADVLPHLRIGILRPNRQRQVKRHAVAVRPFAFDAGIAAGQMRREIEHRTVDAERRARRPFRYAQGQREFRRPVELRREGDRPSQG